MKLYKEEQSPHSAMLALSIGGVLCVAGFALWFITAAAERGLL